ncbi:DinB family protein [Reichenbachiella agariperforans]|uniref:DinB family protein n=1 Tax=Reichenbachiella agariperforans TaxID=156994 RepID=UPI001C09980C|nr:DinB family protein [Reichenbachiella agariperforans]MBU2912493.1 DinB family protein [Reichenbachiella agariperforans]
MTIAKPTNDEYGAFYQGYIDHVIEEVDILGTLKNQRDEWVKCYESLDEEKWNYAYAEGKWTMKQLLRHVIDTERVFGYRAMCISRGDQTPLPGFEQDDYIIGAEDDVNTSQDLLTEFIQVRNANMSMIQNLTKNQLQKTGTASGQKTSSRAIVYILAGHMSHHMNIIKNRYNV